MTLPTHMSRRAALAAIGLSSIAACGGGNGSAVAIGSKDFTEELLLGEMYAQALEAKGIAVRRRLNLGGTQVAMAALQRGDIDCYPEYTGTALINQLKTTRATAGRDIYAYVKREYAQRYGLVWLACAPMNNTQALATTQAIASAHHIRTLSDLSVAAPQLRLGAIEEFTSREDGLPGLIKAYGGFKFKDVRLFDIGLKYKALLGGDVDVVVAFGTDGQIAKDNLVVFQDDKHFWPTYNVAPVVRKETLARVPAIETTLNALSSLLTDDVMRTLNEAIDGDHREPAEVAQQFLKSHALV